MKKIILFIASAVLIVSCGKVKEENEAFTEIAEDYALAESLWDDLGEQVEGSAENVEAKDSTWQSCAIITVDTVGNPFPFSVTVDFGEIGCVGRDGKTRTGQISYTMTGWYREEGSILTTTTSNYTVDGYKVTGTRTATNKGENAIGQLHFSVEVSGASITDLEGQTMSWESSRIRTWIEGEETGFFTSNGSGGFLGWDGITDDVYEITGSANGVSRSGNTFDIDITSALRVQLDCIWITEGVLSLKPEDYDARTLDYGDGTCDNKALLSTNRKDVEITLRG
ncbi:hypothetical protein N9545_00695 [Salibacteraceae bacterium]|nr:hypothetical protein [Salibacteraceae bacterium]MDB9709238.1 hypothetical protein [Salibacteraceae bacterium]MDC1304601.1 hypothetical protein [Salibacteraceae bacterium]